MYYCRKLTNDEIASVYDLYMKKDFPANELKPFSIIEKSLEKGQYFCCGIFNGDKFCGYACFVTLLTESKEYCLLDYFAVISDMRGQGIGSEFLRLLKDILKGTEMVICEAENPSGSEEDELIIRQRRVNFYLRNGFVETGVTASVYGVDYILLDFDLGRKHTKDEIRMRYADLYKSFISKTRFDELVASDTRSCLLPYELLARCFSN